MQDVTELIKSRYKQPIEDHQQFYDRDAQRAAERGHKIPRSLGRKSNRDAMIESQMWKAKQVATKFSKTTGLPYDELYLEACQALVKLYNSFKPEKGSNFSTYVNRTLTGLMCNYLRDRSFSIKLPRRIATDSLKLKRAIRTNPGASYSELAAATGFTPEYISELELAVQGPLSIDFYEVEVGV